MHLAHALAAVTLTFGLALPHARAQTVYDDFNGTAIDTNLWTQFGDLKLLGPSGGQLRINAASDLDGVGLYAVHGFRGDFEIIADVRSFSATTRAGDPGLALICFDPLVSSSEAEVGFYSTAGGIALGAEAWKNDKTLGAVRRTTPLRAAMLRLQRRGSTITAAYQEPNKTSWNVLATWTNFFTHPLARWTLEGLSGDKGNVVAAVEKVMVSGTRETGTPNYGARCANLVGVKFGFPFIGGNEFALLGFGGLPHARKPAVALIGGAPAALDLTLLGAPGCFLNLQPAVTLALPNFDVEGDVVMPLAVPNNAFLVGKTLYAQFASLSGLNPLGISWSNGIAFQFKR